MSKKTVTLELNVPDGYEYDGWRVPVTDDLVLLASERSPQYWRARWSAYGPAIILRALPSPTLAVELSRDFVETGANLPAGTILTLSDKDIECFRAALAMEAVANVRALHETEPDAPAATEAGA